MKKNLKQLRKGRDRLLLTFLMLSLTCLCLAQFAGGEGTEEAPWQVATAEHLNNVRNYLGEEHNDKFFIQTANIDLTEATREGGEYWNDGLGWLPIGHVVLDEENQIAEDHRFYGTYNGNRHTVTGLFINCVEPDDATIGNRGLFGWILNASISNLNLTEVDITGRNIIGALAGRIEGSVVLNCSSQGRVTGTNNNIGGLIGYINLESIVENSNSTCRVVGLETIGGLVGLANNQSPIRNSHFAGTATGIRYIGGLTGQNRTGSIINNCYNTGEIEGSWHVGGITGNSTGGANITYSYNTGSITAEGFDIWGGWQSYVGGIAAAISGSVIANCYSTGTITGNHSYVGGLVGFFSLNSEIRDSYFAGSVTGTGNVVGGLVGGTWQADPTPRSVIRDSYNTGDITGERYVGGLAGRHEYDYSIINCYNTGTITATRDYAGGLAGSTRYTSTISNSFTTGNVRAVANPSYAGGAIGYHRTGTTITNCYSTGNVTGGATYRGGFIGRREAAGAIVTNSYWDRETSGHNVASHNGALGRTTAEMTFPYDANTYLNWGIDNPDVNGDIWMADIEAEINNGYPYLFYQGIFEYPLPASNPQPEHQATGITLDLEQLSWVYIHQEQYAMPTGFRVYFNTTGQFGEDDEFEWVAYIENQQNYANSDILPELNTATMYYWQVIPTTRENGVGEGEDARECPVWSFTTRFGAGTGTEDDPYQIATADQLYGVRGFLGEEHDDKFFIQTANINLNVAPYNEDEGWLPIGHWFDAEELLGFHGNYDGDGHTVSGLFINRPETNGQGLFGYTVDAVISGITLTNVNVTGQDQTGALIGRNIGGTIENCSSAGSIRGRNHVGGLVGVSGVTGEITNCHSLCNVTGTSVIGGLVGTNTGIIRNSDSNGNMQGDNQIGGLVGTNAGDIRNSYYNYNAVHINEQNLITTGALYAEHYNQWIDNEREELDIDEYLNRQDDDYLIGSIADLKHLLTFGQFEDYSFLLTNNLNLENDTGFFVPYFRGSLNGDNNTVSNLHVNISFNNDIGLFGYCRGASISNLEIINSNVTGRNQIGGLVGYLDFESTLDNCHSTCTVTGNENIGGLVGYANNESPIRNSHNSGTANGIRNIGGLTGQNRLGSIINNCSNTGDIEGAWHVGGITGSSSGANITYSYNTGSITAESFDIWGSWQTYVGGIAGAISGAEISDCYSTGTITGNHQYVGGLVGFFSLNSEIRNSYFAGSVTGTGSIVGGLVGGTWQATPEPRSIIKDSYNTGNVNGNQYVGGIAGRHRYDYSIINCFNTGNVTATDSEAGGIVGRTENTASILNSYNKGNVSANNYTAGLVAYHRSTGAQSIVNCYTTGTVAPGGAYRGGFIGRRDAGTTVTGSYWNTTTAGTDQGVGTGVETGITGRTSEVMIYPYRLEEVYTDWDFDSGEVWAHDVTRMLNQGYPIMHYQTVPEINSPEVTIQIITRDEGNFILLQWNPVDEANSYRIFSTSNPALDNWGDPIATTGETFYERAIDPDEPARFYRVTASTQEP